MKSIVKEYVEHKKYGRGIIISEETGKILVEFDSQGGNKIFQFPDVFEHFMQFEDESLQKESFQLVQAKKKFIVEENDRKRLVREIQEEQKKQEELEQKKKSRKAAAVKKPKAVKKTVNKVDESSEGEFVEEVDD